MSPSIWYGLVYWSLDLSISVYGLAIFSATSPATSWSTSKSNLVTSSLKGHSHVLVTLGEVSLLSSLHNGSVLDLPLVLLATLVRCQGRQILMHTDKRHLEAFALFDGIGDRRPADV